MISHKKLSSVQGRVLERIISGEVLRAKINRSSDKTVFGLGQYYFQDKTLARFETILALRRRGLIKYVETRNFREVRLRLHEEDTLEERWSGDPSKGKIVIGTYGVKAPWIVGYWHYAPFVELFRSDDPVVARDWARELARTDERYYYGH